MFIDQQNGLSSSSFPEADHRFYGSSRLLGLCDSTSFFISNILDYALLVKCVSEDDFVYLPF